MHAVSSRAFALATTLLGPAIADALAASELVAGIAFTTAFPFMAGNTRLPPGSYEIRPVPALSDVVEVASTTGLVSAYLDVTIIPAVQLPTTSEVVFIRHGDVYVLKRAWAQGEPAGLTATAAHGERAVARARAAREERIAATKTL